MFETKATAEPDTSREADDTLPQTEPSPSPAPPTDEILIRLDADFAEDGTFGHRIMEVTGAVVRVLEANGAVSFQMPIAEIESARNEPLVGGGRLELIAKTGEIVPIV